MKKIFVTIILVIAVAYLFLANHKDTISSTLIDKNKQEYQEVNTSYSTSMVTTSKPNVDTAKLTDEALYPPNAEIHSDLQDIIDASYLTQQEEQLLTLTTDIKASIDEDGVIKVDDLYKTLRTPQFTDVQSILSQNTTTEELAYEEMIKQSILGVDELIQYTSNVSCGEGLCAINFSNIAESDLDSVKLAVREQIDVGSSFTMTTKTDGDNYELRVMSQSQKKETTSFISKELKLF